jgi:hypothetical protein
LTEEERNNVLNTKTVPQHICCTSPFWLYRIYQDTTITIPEVIDLIKKGLVKSRTEILPRIFHTNYHQSNDLLAPFVKTPECLDGSKRQNGTLWVSWSPFWSGASVDRWDILVNNDGKIYPTVGNETNVSLPGYKPGSEVVFFIRPIHKGKPGDWGEYGKCIV